MLILGETAHILSTQHYVSIREQYRYTQICIFFKYLPLPESEEDENGKDSGSGCFLGDSWKLLFIEHTYRVCIDIQDTTNSN